MKKIIEEKLNNSLWPLAMQLKQEHIKIHYPENGYCPLDKTRTPTYHRVIEMIQRVSLSVAAEEMVKNNEGDLIEIGAAEGWTTCLFAELCRKYGRNVYVIDPYNGDECGTQSVYNNFLKIFGEYSDVIIHHRERSTDESSVNLMERVSPIFCYIDGLHSGETPKMDVDNCFKHSKSNALIAVDDTESLNSIVGKYLKGKLSDNITLLQIQKEITDAIFYHKTWHFALKL